MSQTYYDKPGGETIDKQETVLVMLIEAGVSPESAFDAVTAMKYSDRCGEKDEFEADARKCADYMCRAITGVWMEELR